MTKAEVLEGFAFPNPGEADMLQRWLDDATLGTSIRKALVIVGPMCSGKTTLLYRIAEYKGEAPCLYDGRSGIVPAKLSHGDTLRRYRELELCKVILVNDLLVQSHESMIEVLLFASGFKKRIRSKEGKVLEFNIAAPCAVAVSADCTERAERWASVSLSVFDDERMPFLWIHPTIAGAHHGRIKEDGKGAEEAPRKKRKYTRHVKPAEEPGVKVTRRKMADGTTIENRGNCQGGGAV